MDNTEWFTSSSDGKIQIKSIVIYRDLSSEIIRKLDNNIAVNEILDWLRNRTREAFNAEYGKDPQGGALNNAIGRWNEYIATSLLSEVILNVNQENHLNSVIFSLPNSTIEKEGADELSSKFLNLFSRDEFTIGKSLASLVPFKDRIFLPSSDYIIVVLSPSETSLPIQNLLEQQTHDPGSLEIYNLLKGKLKIEEFKAAISLKTSNRSDRRYQPLFEAAMLKAISYIVKRNWRYYMVASDLSAADRAIFERAIAPHGITLEQNYNLVDGTYFYNRKSDLIPLIEDAIYSE